MLSLGSPHSSYKLDKSCWQASTWIINQNFDSMSLYQTGCCARTDFQRFARASFCTEACDKNAAVSRAAASPHAMNGRCRAIFGHILFEAQHFTLGTAVCMICGCVSSLRLAERQVCSYSYVAGTAAALQLRSCFAVHWITENC